MIFLLKDAFKLEFCFFIGCSTLFLIFLRSERHLLATDRLDKQPNEVAVYSLCTGVGVWSVVSDSLQPHGL